MKPRPGGGYWVASSVEAKPGFRLDIWDGETFRPYVDVTPVWTGADLRTMMELPDGELWMGGTGDGCTYRDGRFQFPFVKEEGYTETGVFITEQLADGTVVAGGRDRVLRCAGGSWHEVRSGVDRVRDLIATREGFLWLATASGIYRVLGSDWVQYGVAEGLPSVIAYSVFQDRRGRIWARTTRGLALFHPEADTEPPHTVFDAASSPREIPAGAGARFVFTGLDKWNQTKCDRMLYSYRLDEGGWSRFQSANSVELHALPNGVHRLHVRSMDRNANIDPHPPTFEFRVLSPWYWSRLSASGGHRGSDHRLAERNRRLAIPAPRRADRRAAPGQVTGGIDQPA